MELLHLSTSVSRREHTIRLTIWPMLVFKYFSLLLSSLSKKTTRLSNFLLKHSDWFSYKSQPARKDRMGQLTENTWLVRRNSIQCYKMFIDHLHETSLMFDQLNLIKGSVWPSQEHLPLDCMEWTHVHISERNLQWSLCSWLFLVWDGAQ